MPDRDDQSRTPQHIRDLMDEALELARRRAGVTTVSRRAPEGDEIDRRIERIRRQAQLYRRGNE